MTTAEGKAWAKKMAKARAAKAAGKPTKAKKATSTKAKAKAKPKATKAKAAPKTKRKAVSSVTPKPVRKKRAAKAATKSKVAKLTKVGGVSIPVPDLSGKKGLDYLKGRESFAKKIHKASATGKMKEVPEYRISIGSALKKADTALKLTKGAKNTKNAKLKV